MAEHVDNDNALISQIDKDMGWDKDGTSPSQVADQQGYDCKFMEGAFSATAWKNRKTGLWSVCILSGVGTTLLAKSFKGLEKLYAKLMERHQHPAVQRAMKTGRQVDRDHPVVRGYKNYYHNMWERQYSKWCCRLPEKCSCQLCRIKESKP